MLWIGLTGPMAGGKSTVAARLRTWGFPVLDADRVVHDLLAPGTATEVEVLKEFGEDLRGSDGRLDRRELGRRVFGNPARLARLEAILHPRVRDEVARLRAELSSRGERAAFYDVPLLFEKQMEPQFDAILVVTAPLEIRRARAAARSGWSDAEFAEREARQVPAAEKERKATAVIVNDGDSGPALDAAIRTALARLGLPAPANS